MFNRKLLLITLLTVVSFVSLMAQNIITVHGQVTNPDGEPQDSANILISAFFADSSGVFHSVYTNAEGAYSDEVPSPGQNIFGSVQVSMVDCWGTTQSQQFSVINGDEDIEADFVYCEQIVIDSCTVIILEEWNPGSNYQLTAWTTPGFSVEYAWSTGETTQTIFPQSSGTYCVSAEFSSGCVVEDCIDVNLDSTGNCFAYIISTVSSDGSYTVEAIATGSAPFTYLWNTGESGPVITNLGPGIYCVTIEDATGCTFTSCIILDGFNLCEVYISENPLGGLYAEGFGQPPLSYLWSTGDTNVLIFPVEAGFYCVTMTDGSGCTSSACYQYGSFPDSCYVYVSAFVQDSNGLALQAVGYSGAESWTYLWNTGDTSDIIYIQDPSQSYCVTLTDSEGCSSSACFEANNWCYAWVDLQYLDTTTALLTVYSDPIFNFPGNAPPTYLWSTGDTTSTLTVTESGDYCVTVTAGPGCVTEACATVDFENLNNDCASWVIQYPDSSGQWFAEAFAWGWGTFTYLWSNGDTSSITTIDANEFACVTVTSSFGCETVACIDTFFLPCEAFISTNYISNTEVILTAILWNDPGQNASYLWSTGESGPEITVDEPGTYCVTVMSGGCVKESCIEVYFWNIDSCGVWISADNSSGAGVEYTANAWGVAPFTYLWSSGATDQTYFVDFGIHDLCVTVTDANGCVSSGCNYELDSCYVGLVYSNIPSSNISVESGDPLADIVWSTGDTLNVIQITEPGVYCATITTIFGCVTTSCITVDTLITNDNQNVITGFVFADSASVVTGKVHAFLRAANTGEPFALAGSADIDQSGFYAIPNLANGVYLLKAELPPSGPNELEYIPTYHTNSTTWENAAPHSLPNFLTVTTDIHMVRSTGMNGGGVIGGIVTDPNHILAGDDEEIRDLTGLANVVVLLRDAQGLPLDFMFSLANGSFRFPNLPWGTYRIRFDIAGVPSPDIWVTLTPENPERLQITLVVTGGTVGVEDPTIPEIILYPNPARQEVNVPLPGVNVVYDIQLIDMQGRIVYSGSTKNLNGVLTLGLEDYMPGLYHIHLKSEQSLYYGRFIKQE